MSDILCDNTKIKIMRYDVFDSSSSIFQCVNNKKLNPLVFMSGERNHILSKSFVVYSFSRFSNVLIISKIVDCTWNTWNSWGSCSRTCGGGNKTRSRTQNGQSYGGQECSGSSNSTTSCNTNNCPGEEK